MFAQRIVKSSKVQYLDYKIMGIDDANNRSVPKESNSNHGDTNGTSKEAEEILAEQGGKYLYSDYTPLDDNKNLVYMLQEYVDVCATILRLHAEMDTMHSVLQASRTVQANVIDKTDSFGENIIHELDDFDAKYNSLLRKLKPEYSSGTDLFHLTRGLFTSYLDNVKNEYLHRSQSYDSFIKSQVKDTKTAAVRLFQSWLSRDYYELPSSLTSNSKTSLDVFIDDSDQSQGKYYMIRKTVVAATGRQSKREEADMSLVGRDEKTITYSFLVNGSRLNFWNRLNKVADVGIKELLIPFGLRTPLTEKIKQTLGVIPGLSKEPIEMEPGFVNTEDYYIAAVSLDQDKLAILLAADPSDMDRNVFRITYALHELYDLRDRARAQHSITMLPRIDCILKEDQEPIQDILQMDKLADATDVSKLMLFGRGLFDKTKFLLDHSLVKGAGGTLAKIGIGGQDAIALEEKQRAAISIYNKELVVLFLKAIASSFSNAISEARSKSGIREEIIIRYQRPNGTRREYSAKLKDLNSRLKISQQGMAISDLLGISSSDNSGNDNTDIHYKGMKDAKRDSVP